MKLIKPSFEIIEQPSGLEGMYKHIELVGRVSYKSEDRITENSSKEFVDRMIKLGHGAVLEHGTVYLSSPDGFAGGFHLIRRKYEKNPYSKVKIIHSFMTGIDHIYISTNLRVLIENDWLDDLQYLCEPTEFHEKRITVHFVCDRGVSHEYVRHRVFSFAQESTRYCNYSRDKFNNELTFIKPCWTNIPEGDYGDIFNPKESNITLAPNEYTFINILRETEKYYIELTNNGWKPQEARDVLPLATKTELYMTGFISDWKHFFELRSNKYGRGGAHPQADELATPLYEEFKKRNLI
ncbi:MAG: FAD-dependent thymidylate synthase [Candidatus Coprovivens sp.]